MLKKLVCCHWLLTFALMCVSSLAVGVLSVNFFFLFRANLTLFIETGSFLLFDGALMQLLELLATGILIMLCYILFRTCERVMIDRILR